jgi:hypothetical protein
MGHLESADRAVSAESRLGTNKFQAQFTAYTAGSSDSVGP